MQRLVIALVAITSIFIAHSSSVYAQDSGQAVDPSRGPQQIDEPMNGGSTVKSDQPGPRKTVYVPAGKTVESLAVHDENVVIAGHVLHDVVATNSTITLEPGATVGGTVRTVNCTLLNAAAGITMTTENTGVLTSTSRLVGVYHNVRGVTEPESVARRDDWFGAQLALAILGLFGAALSMIIAPHASRRVAEHVASHPKRDFKIGVMIGLALLVLLVADSVLLKMPVIRYLWAPVGIFVAFAPLALLGFGWLAGMRYIGDCVARRLHRPADGPMFGRMALGLCAFFVLNVFLGCLSPTLGAMSLCAELCIALMGVGASAAVATGGKR